MNKFYTIIIIFLGLVILFFSLRSCRKDDERQKLQEKCNKLEEELQEAANKLDMSLSALDIQKKYVKNILNLVKENKLRLDSLSENDIDNILAIDVKIQSIQNSYNNFKNVQNNNPSESDYITFVEKENEKLIKQLNAVEKNVGVLENTISQQQQIIIKQKEEIEVLVGERKTFLLQLEKLKVKNAEILSHLRKVKDNFEMYKKQNRKEKEDREKSILNKLSEKESASKNQIDSLSALLNNTEKSLSELNSQVPLSSSLRVYYKNSQGNFVELGGSRNKKPKKNIKEIYVSFRINTKKYRGDIKVDFQLACEACNTSKNCVQNIINKPIPIISKDIWAECSEVFDVELQRDCKYKIQIKHGTNKIFDDYVFSTD